MMFTGWSALEHTAAESVRQMRMLAVIITYTLADAATQPRRGLEEYSRIKDLNYGESPHLGRFPEEFLPKTH